MDITLNKPFAANAQADEDDVRKMKKALNRLGYYTPYEKTGISGIPDREVFDALKKFQSDNGLHPNGEARPNDETISALTHNVTNKQSGQYIWRTVGDDKVRAGHAALNGTIRDLSDSPDPAEDYNCRCWAEFKGLKLERLQQEEPLGLEQIIISSMTQKPYKWTDEDFKLHFWNGKGRAVTLAQIGWKVDVIEHAQKIMFDRVVNQVEDIARRVKSGVFTDTWERPYEFKDIVFSLGKSVIRGRFTGAVIEEKGRLKVFAKAYYLLDDEFTDPLGIRQTIFGTSKRDILPDNMLGDAITFASEGTGQSYPITEIWTTSIAGTISAK
ncbi:MAG: peptidoglycan-binding protein [Alphaproteobacteria bacterium]